ncbi:type II toxin-antitoxin system VapC family toxin [Candidatus Woesearchaeota archaeon]|nr:type II toxin-antitoxin system VapC family toxin [Candidatus Woesearchaeota archaeon]
MKVLDSDFIVAVLRKDPAVHTQVEQLSATDESVTTTVFNAQEVLFGAMQRGDAHLAVTRRFLHSLHILTYDVEGMHHAVEITRFLADAGKRIGYFDEMIAGMCIAHNATLLTRNEKHFSRVPGLKIEKW